MNLLQRHAETDGAIWANNTVLTQLLGLSPVLAASVNLTLGLGLGIATFMVCVFSCSTVALIKAHIPHRWRLAWYMLIMASFTTVAEAIAQLYFYSLFLKLDIYLPLICCNVAILVRMETFSIKTSWPIAALDATKTGIGFLIAILALAACREIFISGTFFANWQLLLPTSGELFIDGSNLEEINLSRFVSTQAGAFILLGLLIALINLWKGLINKASIKEPETVVPIKRARVTGRLSRE